MRSDRERQSEKERSFKKQLDDSLISQFVTQVTHSLYATHVLFAGFTRSFSFVPHKYDYVYIQEALAILTQKM